MFNWKGEKKKKDRRRTKEKLWTKPHVHITWHHFPPNIPANKLPNPRTIKKKKDSSLRSPRFRTLGKIVCILWFIERKKRRCQGGMKEPYTIVTRLSSLTELPEKPSKIREPPLAVMLSSGNFKNSSEISLTRAGLMCIPTEKPYSKTQSTCLLICPTSLPTSVTRLSLNFSARIRQIIFLWYDAIFFKSVQLSTIVESVLYRILHGFCCFFFFKWIWSQMVSSSVNCMIFYVWMCRWFHMCFI